MGESLRRAARQALALAAVAVLAVGCASSNPPCTTPMTELQSVQEQATRATQELDEVKSERQKLDAQIKEKERRIAELKAKSTTELERELAMLKKGSGR